MFHIFWRVIYIYVYMNRFLAKKKHDIQPCVRVDTAQHTSHQTNKQTNEEKDENKTKTVNYLNATKWKIENGKKNYIKERKGKTKWLKAIHMIYRSNFIGAEPTQLFYDWRDILHINTKIQELQSTQSTHTLLFYYSIIIYIRFACASLIYIYI